MKKDNRGFSLIEVLVAIMILAIIVAPFLSSFLRATKINARSRKMLRATTVAENIMEGLSGFLIEDISNQFNDNYYQETVDEDGNKDKQGPFFMVLNDSGATHKEVSNDKITIKEGTPPEEKEVADISVRETEPGKKVFSQQSDHLYEYVIKNVTEDRQKFDVKITVDANKYRDQVAKETNPEEYNKYYNIAAGQMFNVAEMNPKTDVVWVEPAGMELKYKDDYIAALQRNAAGNHNTKTFEDTIEVAKKDENFLAHCSRMFSLFISDDRVSLYVSLEYEDSVNNETVSAILNTEEKYFPGITSADKRKKLKNIFWCYYPLYELKKDIIQITDFTGDSSYDVYNPPEELVIPDDYHYNIYIIKQEKNSDSNYKEKNYKVQLNVYNYAQYCNDMYDTDYDASAADMFPFTIRGNLGHYFEKENPASGEPQGLISDQVDFRFKYGTSDNYFSVIDRPLTQKELESMEIYDNTIRYSGVDKSTKNLIYYTIVDVYEEGGITVADDGSYTIDDSKHIAKLDSNQPWVTK